MLSSDRKGMDLKFSVKVKLFGKEIAHPDPFWGVSSNETSGSGKGASLSYVVSHSHPLPRVLGDHGVDGLGLGGDLFIPGRRTDRPTDRRAARRRGDGARRAVALAVKRTSHFNARSSAAVASSSGSH